MESGGEPEQSLPLTAEEEALKRNTDCVYFLASPLTCKKGTECEYRHSEGARVNPRDCWYWLNGNCLNPRCTFRHPPLDGLFGIPGTTSGLAPIPSQTVALTHVPATNGPASYNLNKSNVPCYYFQKGHCLRGDKCPFMHGPQQTGNPVPQQVVKVSTPPPDPVSTIKKDSWGLKECTSQQSMDEAKFDKLVEMPLAPVKPAAKSENVPDNGFANKQTTLPYASEDELPSFQQSNVPVNGGIALGQPRCHQSQSIDEHLQNGREADESLRESSPGFDVLVDNNVEESDYFHDEGGFRRAPVQGGRNLNHVSDFDYHHSDYEPLPSLERDQYNGVFEYDSYGRLDNRYHQEQQRISCERILDRASMPEKRMLQREKSYHDIDGSDLRHRLLKRRRPDSSRSALSPDRCGKLDQRDNHARHAHRGDRRIHMESSISSRLQGRITLPARSLPDRPTDLRSERDRDKRRHRGRSSPARSINYQGRYHDKIKRRPHDDFSDVRNVGDQPIIREDADPLNFAGPKSLAELKGAKLSENFQDLKNIKLGRTFGNQESEGSSFEGPKPLGIILKRKREPASGNGAISSNGDNNNQRDIEGGIGSSVTAATEKEGDYAADCPAESKVTGVDEEEEEGIIPVEEELPNDGQTSTKGNIHEVEVGMTVGAMDDQELENYGQRDGESDYEAVEGGEFKQEDAENAYQEDEEDDEDDFAKKVGAMFS
ncbi:zinc finger CCCH domain-containing protein 32-like [Phoenix dactylifera]|uniref:Zinc finger CCCH domain-containing protein 32-like n=1 Tax=Phoenix dactylifera TaxID=42345 RepID=A0A8B7BH71_PHODC|nr:zinc finger CCCH domain-containing protein 32-like [Phoenix dactylifera]